MKAFSVIAGYKTAEDVRHAVQVVRAESSFQVGDPSIFRSDEIAENPASELIPHSPPGQGKSLVYGSLLVGSTLAGAAVWGMLHAMFLVNRFHLWESLGIGALSGIVLGAIGSMILSNLGGLQGDGNRDLEPHLKLDVIDKAVFIAAVPVSNAARAFDVEALLERETNTVEAVTVRKGVPVTDARQF